MNRKGTSASWHLSFEQEYCITETISSIQKGLIDKFNHSHLARFSAMQIFLANLSIKPKTYFKFAIPEETSYQKLLSFSLNTMWQGASLHPHSKTRTTTASFPREHSLQPLVPLPVRTTGCKRWHRTGVQFWSGFIFGFGDLLLFTHHPFKQNKTNLFFFLSCS